MCKVKFVEVSQIMEDDVAIGMQYVDNWMVISGFIGIDAAFNSFKDIVNQIVTEKQSIILCRDDVKRFAKAISCTLRENGIESPGSKIIFRSFKDFLYNNYEVKRIIMNPRTLEYYPLNKAFIINKL